MLKNIKIIAMLCLITSVGRFVLDSFLPSLPAVGQYFHVTGTHAQLTLTFYLFGFGFSQLIYGPLSDRYGRRRIIIIGMFIFLLGCFACALASSFFFLLVARLIAGIGAGACGALNRAIASDCYKGAAFSKAWSYTTSVVVITLIIAPILGGYIQETSDWRGNFLLATFFVGISLLIIAKFLPETSQPAERIGLSIDKVVNNYYHMLSTPKFLIPTFNYTLAFAGLIVYFQMSPFLYIDIFGLTPIEYGWSSAAVAFSYLVGGQIVNRLSFHCSQRTLILLGNLLLVIGGLALLGMSYLKLDCEHNVLVLSCIYVVGARIVIPNAIAVSLEEFRHLGGSSSALIGFIQTFGSFAISFGIAELNQESALVLGSSFALLGAFSLIICLFMRAEKEKHSINVSQLVIEKS